MKTVLIPTSHNVYIEYEVGSVAQRFFALFIDTIVMIVGYIVSLWILWAIIGNNDVDEYEWMFYVLCLPWFLVYHLISEILLDGKTLGKMAVGLKVVSLSGTNVSIQQYLMRWMFRIIEMGMTFFSLAALMVSSTEKGQRLGDINANTTVISTKPSNSLSIKDIAKIHKEANTRKVQFPEIANWSEEDMLLIKNAVERYTKYKNKAHENVVRELFDKCCERLDLTERPKKKTAFLKMLIKDYISLTR